MRFVEHFSALQRTSRLAKIEKSQNWDFSLYISLLAHKNVTVSWLERQKPLPRSSFVQANILTNDKYQLHPARVAPVMNEFHSYQIHNNTVGAHGQWFTVSTVHIVVRSSNIFTIELVISARTSQTQWLNKHKTDLPDRSANGVLPCLARRI